MNPTRAWSGRAVTAARAVVATWLPAPCGQCGKPVTAERPWVIGHIKSRHEYPELTWEMTNWQPEHRACSDRSGRAVVVAKARNDARRDLGLLPEDAPSLAEAPLPVSPSEALSHPPLSGFALPVPADATGRPFDVRPGLDWSPDYLRSVPWLAEFADVPDDAAPPLYMSRPPEHATGSYGAECIAWVEEELKIRLRWWQRLAITLQLAHDEAGLLVYRTFIESAPRRAGKSVRMRAIALWRLEHARRFGETQLVMHTGSDLAICREIQRGAWVWATAQWGKDSVTKANGKEAIETWSGDRWLTRSQDAVYGYDVTLGIVDEGWDVKPETVTEGMEPATLERSQPQIYLTSTAHRRATSLMRGQISTALAMDDPEVALLMWAATPGSDPSDPAVWKAASPHWTEDRRKLIARKYDAALAGQADPQADDPDPIAGFTAQYLNVWRLKQRKAERGDPLTTAEAWEDLGGYVIGEGAPVAAAIVPGFGTGVSVVLAYPAGWVDGQETGASGKHVVAVATDHATVAQAAEHVRSSGFRTGVLVTKGLEEDPALRGLAPRPQALRAAEAVQQLGALMRDDVLRHDDGKHLQEQVTAVRTVKGTDGPRIVSPDRTDAIKATALAVNAARQKLTRKVKTRFIAPTPRLN